MASAPQIQFPQETRDQKKNRSDAHGITLVDDTDYGGRKVRSHHAKYDGEPYRVMARVGSHLETTSA